MGEIDLDCRRGQILRFVNLAGKKLTWGDVFRGMAMVGIPMLLVLKQPDLGTALTYSPILLMGLFLGGISWRKALILALVALVSFGVIWKSNRGG